MTWEDLALLAKAMVDRKDPHIKEKVHAIVEGVVYELDIHESLTSGRPYLVPAVSLEIDDAEG